MLHPTRFSAKFTVRDFLHLRDKEDMPLTNSDNQLVLVRSTLRLPIHIIPTPLTFMERQVCRGEPNPFLLNLHLNLHPLDHEVYLN